MSRYFSDRESGPRPRNSETIDLAPWGAVVAAVDSRITNGSFGHSFPSECDDGKGITGTSRHLMGLAAVGAIPELAEAKPVEEPTWAPSAFSGWPLRPDRLPSTLAILDLVEFCFDHVAEPSVIDHHGFLRHDHLRFDVEAGRVRWRSEINDLFARNGIAYELTAGGQVIRLGTPLVTDAVRAAVFNTGDEVLDGLLERAREKYLSVEPATRSESLEQLWDALERTKTVLDTDKKIGMRALINRVASSQNLADALEAEALSLTKIGNEYRIRHHETNKTSLASGDIDYLFHRCFAFLAYLLGLNPA